MQTHSARRSHASKFATLVLAVVAAALTAMSVAPPAPIAVAPAGLPHHSPRTAEAQRGPSPFGYLEFDWDGAVPGFAPLSDDPTGSVR